MAYWLFKSEPEAWSWDAQVKAGKAGTEWTGVRNFAARNHMRAMKKGDRGFFYHSGTERAVVGIVEVVKEIHPDSTDPAWECVDVAAREAAAEAGHARSGQGGEAPRRDGAGPPLAPVGPAGQPTRNGSSICKMGGAVSVGRPSTLRPLTQRSAPALRRHARCIGASRRQKRLPSGGRTCPRKIYPVPAEWAKRRLRRQRQVSRRCTSARSPTRTRFWGEQARRHRLDQALHAGQEHLLQAPRRLDQVVRGRHAQRLGQLPRPPPRRRAATRPPSSGRATTRTSTAHDHLPRAARARSAASPTCCTSLGVAQGRPRHHLPADDPGGRGCAMLACARIGAIHSVVFGGFSPDSLAGRIDDCDSQAGHHRRRGRCAAASDRAAQAQRRRGAGASRPATSKVIVIRAHRRPGRHEGRPRHLVARGWPTASTTTAAPSADERRGPALHPLHLRLDRQAEGRAAHHRRLSRLRRADPPARSSTITTATSTGAPPTSAGSPATATSSTARSPTARRR